MGEAGGGRVGAGGAWWGNLVGKFGGEFLWETLVGNFGVIAKNILVGKI